MSEVVRQRDIKHFRYGPIVTPFQKPGEIWDRPIGQFCQKAAAWRVAFFWLIPLNIVLFLLMLLLIMSPWSQVIAVEMTHKGFVTRVGVVPYNFTPTEQMYQHFSASFVRSFYSVQTEKNQDLVSVASSPEILKNYHEWQGSHSAAHDIVIIDRVEKLSDILYRVYWAEGTHQTKNVGLTKGKQMQTTLKIQIQPPVSEAAIMLNPLGFHVDEMASKKNG